jgi:glycosyltransferase involved in cell wall biosynthesis
MLAIVIPYYKINFFEETLVSLSNQTNKNFNVYIGDDASKESPLFLLKRFNKKINYTYKRFENNLGGVSLVKQWERCIDLSDEEEWLMILGDDDTISDNFIEEFYFNLPKSNNLIRFSSYYMDSLGEKWSNMYTFPKEQSVSDSYYNHFIGLTRSSLSEHVFKRSIYNQKGFTEYPLAWHSDDKAWLDFVDFGNIYSINKASVGVRISDISISGKEDNLFLKRKARYLFFNNLIFKKIHLFNRYQQKKLLLEYGVLIKEQNKISIYNLVFIAFKLLRIGAFISLLKFIRRMFIAKFKTE